MIKEIKSHNSY